MQPSISARRSGGFSLIELILALALGLIVVTGIVQLFVGNSQTYNILNGQARMQESARFALDFISRATRRAGYFGCAHSEGNLVWALTGGSVANSALVPEFDMTRPVAGFDDVAGQAQVASLPTTGGNRMDPDPSFGIDTAAIQPNTDVLVVRSLEVPGWRLTEEMFPAGNPRISDASGIDGNDIVMLANCEQAAVFRVTGTAAVGANVIELQHQALGGNAFQNTISNLSSIGRTYQEDSVVGRIQSSFFFIAEGAGQDRDGNAPLALWEKVGRDAPRELVQGVENLQVLYGIDNTLNDGIANANEYVTAGDLDPNDANVVSLRVSVTVNSVDPVTDDGNVLRRTFSKTILLRNANPEAV